MNKISIHGLPRSGTSWLGEIVNSSEYVAYRYQPLFSYEFKHRLTENSTESQINDFFSDISRTSDPFVLRTVERTNGRFPSFSKADISAIAYKEVRYHQILPNLLRSSPDVRLVLLVRNPLAVLNSWLDAPREFRSDLGWSRLDEWRYAMKKNLNRPEEYNGFERWKEATQLFMHLSSRYSDRVILVSYSDLVARTDSTVKGLFKFLDLTLTDQTLDFIKRNSATADDDPYSVNRSVSADVKWKTGLETEIIEEVSRDLKGTSLERFITS